MYHIIYKGARSNNKKAKKIIGLEEKEESFLLLKRKIYMPLYTHHLESTMRIESANPK